MTPARRGLRDEAVPHPLHPSLAEAIASWHGDHPLARLGAALRGHERRRVFLDACAEAVVGKRLLDAGFDVRFEVPTPNGRAVDFEASRNGGRICLHVKRLANERPGRRRLSISSRLRSLERIERPYVVSVRWREGGGDRAIRRLVAEASTFILRARVGDELVVTDEHGAEVGGVRIVAPWQGPRVALVIGLPEGFIDDAPRMRRLFSRAARQFMPRAANVIVLASAHDEDAVEFENALLGAPEERWDELPPRGRRIAFGRAADGFWHGRRHADSRLAAWFRLDPTSDRLASTVRARVSPAPDPDALALLEQIFGTAIPSRSVS